MCIRDSDDGFDTGGPVDLTDAQIGGSLRLSAGRLRAGAAEPQRAGDRRAPQPQRGRARRRGRGKQRDEVGGGELDAREVGVPACGERVREIVHGPILSCAEKLSCAENVAGTVLSAHGR